MKKIFLLVTVVMLITVITCLPVGAMQANKLISTNLTNDTFITNVSDSAILKQSIIDTDYAELLKVKQKYNFDGSNVFKIVYIVVCATIIISVVVVLLIKIQKSEKNKRNKK